MESCSARQEILFNTVVDAGVGAITADIPRINGYTAGRNSCMAVYKSGLTKLRNGTAQHMSTGVMKKGIKGGIVDGLAMDVYYGAKQYFQNHF